MRFPFPSFIISVFAFVSIQGACSSKQEHEKAPEVTLPVETAPIEKSEIVAPPSLTSLAVVHDFEDDAANSPARGFSAALTGSGGPIEWKVQERADAVSGNKVVAQLSGDRTNTRYPHLVRDDVALADVDVSVSFRTISGKVDASGGLIFRYQDKDNFYVVRANSLEGNVVAYKTENGKRSSLGVLGKSEQYGVDVTVPHQAWNRLRVVAKGALFEIHLADAKIFEVEDSTFSAPGKVGLWTKADAITEFDDLRVLSME